MLFDNLKINETIKENLKLLNYIIPTKIQQEVIPQFLDKKDILAIAQTGTGKTCAFCVPIINFLIEKKVELNSSNTPIALILAPNRELCEQIGKNIINYSLNTKIKIEILHGGENFIEQENKIENKKYDILISTPKRICDLIKNDKINLKKIEFFIIDEFDKILEENFNSNLKYLNKKLPKLKQSVFFSATSTTQLEDISKLILKNPIKIEIFKKIDLNLIKQNLLFIQTEHKFKSILELLQTEKITSTIIFTNSKKTADELVRFLKNNQIYSEALHSGKSNVHRTKVVEKIKNKKNKILVATDLAARGLDIDNISHIFNFEMPTSPNIYIHRIGRCARKGVTGIAISLCSSSEKIFVEKIKKEKNIKFNLIKNKYHSNFAQKAQGENAKPKFKSKINNFGKTKKNPKFKKRILKSWKINK